MALAETGKGHFLFRSPLFKETKRILRQQAKNPQGEITYVKRDKEDKETRVTFSPYQYVQNGMTDALYEIFNDMYPVDAINTSAEEFYIKDTQGLVPPKESVAVDQHSAQEPAELTKDAIRTFLNSPNAFEIMLIHTEKVDEQEIPVYTVHDEKQIAAWKQPANKEAAVKFLSMLFREQAEVIVFSYKVTQLTPVK